MRLKSFRRALRVFHTILEMSLTYQIDDHWRGEYMKSSVGYYVESSFIDTHHSIGVRLLPPSGTTRVLWYKARKKQDDSSACK